MRRVHDHSLSSYLLYLPFNFRFLWANLLENRAAGGGWSQCCRSNCDLDPICSRFFPKPFTPHCSLRCRLLTVLLSACMLAFAAASAFPLTRSPLLRKHSAPNYSCFIFQRLERQRHGGKSSMGVLLLATASTSLPFSSNNRRCRYLLLALCMFLLSVADPVMDGM